MFQRGVSPINSCVWYVCMFIMILILIFQFLCYSPPTPFFCRITILVNRGWVPKDRFNPATRQEGQVCNGTALLSTTKLVPGGRTVLRGYHALERNE